jgi:TadE-like protein
MKLGDRGAVLVEFAIILPVMMLLTLGMFDVGIMLLQSMQLNFVTQGAAFAEANAKIPGSGFSPGSGITWATAQLPPPAASAAIDPRLLAHPDYAARLARLVPGFRHPRPIFPAHFALAQISG